MSRTTRQTFNIEGRDCSTNTALLFLGFFKLILQRGDHSNLACTRWLWKTRLLLSKWPPARSRLQRASAPTAIDEAV